MEHPSSRAAVAFVTLVGVLPAQTFIVDANNGPGTHYRDLPEAIAKVPDGAVLRVRPGVYSPFVLQNKSLRIIGDAAAIAGAAVLGPLRATDRVLLSGLSIDDTKVPQPTPPLRIANAAGIVVLHDFELRSTWRRPQRLAGLHVSDSANVQLLDSKFLFATARFIRSNVMAAETSMSGAGGITINNGTASAPGLVGIHQTGGNLMMAASWGIGGDGVDGNSWPASDGGPGMLVDGGGGLLMFRCTALGGSGGKATGTGGNGMQVRGSVAHIFQSSIYGGCSGTGCNNRATNWVFDSASQFINEKYTPPAVALTFGEPVAGKPFDVDLLAKGQNQALMLIGFDLTWHTLTPIGHIGNIFVPPVVVLGQFQVPYMGVLRLPLHIPQGWHRDLPVYLQFLTWEPKEPLRLWASNPIMLLVKSKT